jgi:ABC-2 type transport system permease protein
MIDLRKVVEIARVNLVRQVRDRTDLFFVFVLPTLIILALGLQFGGGGRARIGVVVPAGDAAAVILVDALRADAVDFDVRPFMDEGELRARVERGQLEAGLVVPDGFAATLRGTGTAEVRYLGTPESLTAGIRAPVEAAIARVAAITTAARIADAEGAGPYEAAAAEAEAAYAAVPGITVDVARVGEAGLFAGFNQFTLGATSQLVMFMFLTSMTAATRLVVTRQLGISRRMVSTPTSAGSIVAGEALGRFGVAMLQAGYIVAVTAIVFNVAWGDPVAATAIIVLFGAVAAGIAMLVGAVSRNPDQAGALAIFASLMLALLGGCMFPYQMMPEQMQAIARLIPHSWALLGLQSLITGGGGVESVAPNLAVLGAFAVASLGLASWRFRKAITG